ncbi:alpha/beta fold hydrolase [Ammoniphilus sp. CFH 90114]|uniref:alpha/beta fold hydrolase n=1 Tax=Ammoniphilus sp. CFH 90114 TaxID=2493665 RepID=UPI00100E0E45|nr:alpha/beta hydrolase [Ammoniphilus sp. CFH 90114]RXT05729.1 alpha/beta hydrolase [Ammoniphilus sp. CFH 90114]
MPKMDVNGAILHYDSEGEGIPIIFIHPPVLTTKGFTYQVRDLSPYFQVIRFDIRGHGHSSPSSLPITYSLIADDMIAIMDKLGLEKAYFCGYSMGGTAVLEVLLRYPERSLGGIVLGGLSEVLDLRLRSQILLGATIAKAGGVELLARAVSSTNSDTLELFREQYQEARRGSARNIEQYYRTGLDYNCTSRLGEITLPILLLYGARDKRFLHYAQLLHEKLPNNELKFISNVKHHLPTRAAIEMNDLIKQFIYTHHRPSEEIPQEYFSPYQVLSELPNDPGVFPRA